jgi:hypothetical protein
MSYRFRFVAILFLVVSTTALSQGLPEVNKGILEEGEKHNQAMLHITHLTKKIGPRLLGSSNLTKACNWSLGQFKKWGLSNVHFEPYMDVPIGFERGKQQLGRMVSPSKRDFQFTTFAWTPGTKGSISGAAILEPKSSEEIERLGAKLKGAWVLADGPALAMRSRPDTILDERRKSIEAKGIAGWVFASDSELLHTSGSWQKLDFANLPSIPLVVVRASDAKAIRDELSLEKPVVLDFNIDNRFVKGPVKVGNVVADIPGTEKPDEYVIVGAHLDSWDGPGSEGACDNGTGATAVIEAARVLSKLNVKPKRTIRFVLFTGEEEGLLGSRAYMRQHEKELQKISAVFINDSGTNYISGLMCHDSMAPQLELATVLLKKAGSPYEFAITKTSNPPSRNGGGSDHAPFVEQGIPAFYMRSSGKSNYWQIWHTQNDNLEQVVPDSLKRSGLVFAVLAYNLACSDRLLPRP